MATHTRTRSIESHHRLCGDSSAKIGLTLVYLVSRRDRMLEMVQSVNGSFSTTTTQSAADAVAYTDGGFGDVVQAPTR